VEREALAEREVVYGFTVSVALFRTPYTVA